MFDSLVDRVDSRSTLYRVNDHNIKGSKNVDLTEHW